MFKKLATAALISLASAGACASGPTATDDPILFIHGYLGELYPFMSGGSTPLHYWQALPSNLSTESNVNQYFFKWNTINEGVTDATLVRLHDELKKIYDGDTNGEKGVDIVAHSFGGLLIRAYIRKYQAEYINRVVTLGTPHEGTPIAAYGAELQDACSAFLPTMPLTNVTCLNSTDKITTEIGAQQMLPDSAFLKDLNTQYRYVARLLALYSPYDEIVPMWSANGWDAGQRYARQSATCNYRGFSPVALYHFGILNRTYTAEQINNWLEKGENKNHQAIDMKDDMICSTHKIEL